MTGLWTTGLRLTLVALILGVTPLGLAMALGAGRTPSGRLSAAGALAVALALAAALGLHLAGAPLTPRSMALTHLAFLLPVLILWRLSPRHERPVFRRPDGMACAAALLVVALVLPYTPFTGVDTYKWQDLATSVRMERSLPWIVHPLSVFGFTPRAYPPAHPVLLATVQMVGGLGVEGGFGVVSAGVALLGLAAATRLAGRWLAPRWALATGLLYVLSPVFMRYAHWATGRGLFAALFPVFIVLLLPDPVRDGARGGRLRRGLSAGALAILLLLTHKAAWVAVPLALLAAGLSVTARSCRRSANGGIPLMARGALALALLAPAALLVPAAYLPGPAGLAAGCVRMALWRFGWMFPVALAGWWMPPVTGMASADRRFLTLAMLPAIPLAFDPQMYGALYALPFVCIHAVLGVQRLGVRLRPRHRQAGLALLAALSLSAAIATIVARSRMAATPALRQAALFLETVDPEGPFQIHAPGHARTRIQAYVSGCPRFTVSPGADARVRRAPFPGGPSSLRAAVTAWTAWLRGPFALTHTDADWYGTPGRHYYFIIKGTGHAPPEATRIYHRDGIAIYLQKGRAVNGAMPGKRP